jgi:hypothetical protein
MAYSENEKKFVVVANKRAPIVEVLNGMGHAMVSIVGSATPGDVSEMELLDYPFADGTLAGKLSKFPVIVLQSKNSNQLAKLYRTANEASVRVSAFVRAMLGHSSDEQIAATQQLNVEDHDLIVVCLWGDAAVLDPMLKRFSCFKERNDLVETSQHS